MQIAFFRVAQGTALGTLTEDQRAEAKFVAELISGKFGKSSKVFYHSGSKTSVETAGIFRQVPMDVTGSDWGDLLGSGTNRLAIIWNKVKECSSEERLVLLVGSNAEPLIRYICGQCSIAVKRISIEQGEALLLDLETKEFGFASRNNERNEVWQNAHRQWEEKICKVPDMALLKTMFPGLNWLIGYSSIMDGTDFDIRIRFFSPKDLSKPDSQWRTGVIVLGYKEGDIVFDFRLKYDNVGVGNSIERCWYLMHSPLLACLEVINTDPEIQYQLSNGDPLLAWSNMETPAWVKEAEIYCASTRT